MERQAVKSRAERLQCPVDEDAEYENTYWCNRDLIPIPPERRTWTWQGFAGYWVIAGINPTAWTIGSTLLALGLSVGQAMAMVIVATMVIAALAVGAGWPGSHQRLGFTVTSRRCVRDPSAGRAGEGSRGRHISARSPRGTCFN